MDDIESILPRAEEMLRHAEDGAHLQSSIQRLRSIRRELAREAEIEARFGTEADRDAEALSLIHI